MVTLIHITKRALANAKGECMKQESYANICDGSFVNGSAVVFAKYIQTNVTCPACLVLLDAELEGRGVEVAKQRAEIEAGR